MLLLTEAALAATRIPALQGALAAILADLRDVIADWLAGHSHPGDAISTAAVIVAALDGHALQRAVDPQLPVEPLRAGLRAVVARTPLPPTERS